MNRKFRKTALLMGALALLGLGYSSNANAAGAPQEVQQATKKITGSVVDAESNEPLIGVSVRVPDTSVGVLTDVDGKFSIPLPAGAKSLNSGIFERYSKFDIGFPQDCQ